MSSPTFDIVRGLNTLISGPRYSGVFVEHSEEEYNALDWLDIRDKPQWSDVEQATLSYLRVKIAHNVNERTDQIITEEWRYSGASDIEVSTSLEWQFDVLNLWLIRTSGMVTFPYSIHAKMDDNAISHYIVIADADELNIFYFEMFGHIAASLESGRTEKDSLVAMTRTQLEEYRDLR